VDLVDDLEESLRRRRLYGLYPAQVTSIKDPAGQGRVRVKLPWSPDGDGESYEVWARLAVLMAGPNRGTWFATRPRRRWTAPATTTRRRSARATASR